MNKMFKKLLAVAAVVATAASLSVSAFAAGETAALTETKDGVTVSGYEAVTGATQYTVMLFEDSFTTDYDVAKIFYINQDADVDALLTNMFFKATDGKNVLPDGDYTVRIGNDKGTTVDVDLKVSTTPAGIEITLDYGDVNGDKAVNGADASLILQKGIGAVTGFTDQENRAIPEVVGDVNGDGAVNGADASLILQKGIGAVTGFTDQKGNPLTTYTYTYVAPVE